MFLIGFLTVGLIVYVCNI